MMTITDFRVRKSKPKYQSCAVCRRRKLRCDRRSPCQRCINSQCVHLCTYSLRDNETRTEVNLRETGPPKELRTMATYEASENERAANQRLTSNISELEQRPSRTEDPRYSYSSIQDSAPPNHSSNDTTVSFTKPPVQAHIPGLGMVEVLDIFSHGKHDNTRVWERGHWASLISKFTDVMNVASDNRENVKGYYRERKGISTPESDIMTQNCASRMRNVWIPPRQTVELLVSRYSNTFSHSHRVLHIPSFLDDVESILVGDSRHSTFSLACFLCTLSIGNCCLNMESEDSSPMVRKTSVLEWLEATRLWLQTSSLTRKVSVHGLQARYLFLLACQVCGVDLDGNWISSGALSMEAIIEAEVQSSITAGLPLCISPEDFDVLPPLNINDESISENDSMNPEPKPSGIFTRASYQIIQSQSLHARIRAAIILNRTKSVSYDGVMQLSANLIKSRNAISQLLTRDNSANDIHASTKQFLMSYFDLLIHRFLLALHRPFTMKGAYVAGFHYSRIRCLSSSLTSLDCLGISPSPETGARHTHPLCTFSGSYFIDDLFNSAISICLELMLERQANSKKYMFLVMANASVKSRLSGRESLDGISDALWQNLAKYKRLLEEGSRNTMSIGNEEVRIPTSQLNIVGNDWDDGLFDLITAFTTAELGANASL
ncbi:fungal specific transcription factor domain-containing protein [Aspergillus alliaceus]|uniref:fungal specific transcription factor domain-containing protein n=1 Tax=Petromyces alliaceus TaxID=209559 RepID=UPI0012A5676A|nr:uncharacterized protein BDW43DRAFT_299972 [Aspergillus alliaceus]KAB8234053.1 hypothetical protein BDW43DRAFT_299972 [Aspergillus alliaceus]